MADQEKVSVEGEVEAPKPNYELDKNVQARMRAGRRSSARNAGKDMAAEEAPKPEEETKPEEEALKAEDEPKPEEAGLVADAKEQVAEAEEEKSESPEEKSSEEEPQTSEEQAPEAELPQSAEEIPERVGEYQAPEGESHDELVHQYHEALMFGDIEKANELYHRLREHRYAENSHRTKSEAQAEREAKDYLKAVDEICAVHPELAEDGIHTDKVLALKDVYWKSGMREADALRKAVADLYPEAKAEAPVEEPKVEEIAPVVEAPVSEVEPAKDEEMPMVPDMTERKARKKELAPVPSASAKNVPEPEPEKPTRSSAIEEMKRARGQL